MKQDQNTILNNVTCAPNAPKENAPTPKLTLLSHDEPIRTNDINVTDATGQDLSSIFCDTNTPNENNATDNTNEPPHKKTRLNEGRLNIFFGNNCLFQPVNSCLNLTTLVSDFWFTII